MLFHRVIQLLPCIGFGVCFAQNGADDKSAAYALINQARSAHGLQPLAWNPDLATYAQIWADEMGSGRSPFAHASGQYRPLQGENLYEQQAGQCDSSYDTAFQAAATTWLAQESLYGNQPITTGHEPWLHFAQCLWSTTTQIGCARSYDIHTPFKIYIVCRFFPEGNIIGQKPFYLGTR